VLSPPAGGAGTVAVELDGRPIASDRAGADVHDAVVRVDRQRLYHLVAAPKAEHRVLTLRPTPGVAAYAFTFG
jgi:thioredoxin family protein